MAERAYPEDPAYVNKTKYYDALMERYAFGSAFTENKFVLDIPCGTGWGASTIDNANGIIGADNSEDAINYAIQHYSNEYLLCNMAQLPFKNAVFDVALVFEGIEHISRKQGIEFFNELQYVIKKDGIIAGSVPILDQEGYSTGNPFHKFEYPKDYLEIIFSHNYEILEFTVKKGGDGPIVFFVLRNNRINHKAILITDKQQIKEIKYCENKNKVLIIIDSKVDISSLKFAADDFIIYEFPPLMVRKQSREKNKRLKNRIISAIRKMRNS